MKRPTPTTSLHTESCTFTASKDYRFWLEYTAFTAASSDHCDRAYNNILTGFY